MNVKIIKKLGSGMMGIVYLTNIDGKQAVTKIEKYDGDLTTKSPFIRQLIFNDKVARLYPDRFVTLVSSGSVNDCKLKNKFKNSSSENSSDENFDKCSILSYQPVLKYTLEDILEKLTPKKKLKIFKILETTISIMNENGFVHREIHTENIMCDKSLDKWYLIDYGSVKHKSFIKSPKKQYAFYNNIPDIIATMRYFIEDPVVDYIMKKWKNQKKKNSPETKLFVEKKFTDFKKALSIIKKDSRYSEIKKYLPKKKFKKNITEEIIRMLCSLIYYDFYIEAYLTEFMDTKIAKSNMNLIQPNRDYFLNVIKNL
jgi:serine/threonine protein kinase